MSSSQKWNPMVSLDDKRLPDDINDIPEVVLWRAQWSRDVMPDASVKHSQD